MTGDFLYRSIIMGVGATVLLDLWALLLFRSFGFPQPNWAMVGRWFGHLPAGQFFHDDIGRSPAICRELQLGWLVHYGVGILFAAVTLLIGGAAWARSPGLLLPLIVGLVTVGCGWFILQPGMGAGIAASKKPERNRIRLLNILGHMVFGFGLYGTALLIR
jgi:Protein of unknown function (DUF2938)